MPESFSMKLNSQERTFLVRQAQAGGETQQWPVFSGTGKDRNNPNSTDKANAGPLPKGTYYIVDRPSGGRLGYIRDWWSEKDVWFALFRQDKHIDDQTTINGVRRGEFRMHPGSLSVGCVTFVNKTNFNEVRAILLAAETQKIPGSDVDYYGTLVVD